MVSVAVEAFIKICVELSVLTFAVSLLICLVFQLIRKKEGFDTGFFRVFIVCAVGDCVCNYIVCFVCHFPNTGASSEFFNQQLLLPSTFLCTCIYPIAGFGSRVSFIGQMVIAANRFTAIYFPLKHQKIWKPQSTNLIICLNLFTGFLLQSPSIFTTGHYVKEYNCVYGMAFGTIDVGELNRFTQSATTVISGITCLALSISTVVKLNLLFRKGAVSIQHKKDIPLLVYSSILTFEMVIMGFCYAVNRDSNLTGGNNFFLIAYSWTIFLYLLSPSVLLFLTRYRLFISYRYKQKWILVKT